MKRNTTLTYESFLTLVSGSFLTRNERHKQMQSNLKPKNRNISKNTTVVSLMWSPPEEALCQIGTVKSVPFRSIQFNQVH